MPPVTHFRWPGWLALIPFVALGEPAMDAQPLAKLGNCPSGYSTSGLYCIPGRQARLALEKRGQCPSGYTASEAYCLASGQARPALPRLGPSCPSGWSMSGDYCLRR